MKKQYFLQVVQALRVSEEIVLYGHRLEIPPKETEAVISFLENEYQKEILDYPYKVPRFDKEAALWAAKIIYIAAQLILYRKDEAADLVRLLPDYISTPSPSSIVSVDLCLRFLPQMILQLKLIDVEDPLIDVLEKKLSIWHYSGIRYDLNVEELDYTIINSNACLEQLYLNRIVHFKNKMLANLPIFKDKINANLGLYKKEFWSELEDLKN